ncbi:MAG TPA: DUF1598 domain-containing protein [Pirellulaceae bacterium]|jgi:hypothetical protein
MRQYPFLHVNRYALVAIACLSFCHASLVAADPAAPTQHLVQQQLAAGEFGPAITAARGVEDPALRDKLLSEIAAAQGAAGAPKAALATAADINSDLARKAMLSSMAAQSGPGSNSGSGSKRGARGGAAMADFTSLIELITTTLKPDSWDDVGGPGAIDEFRGGVYVDTAGLMSKLPPRTDASLVAVRRAGLDVTQTGDPRRAAPLRKVSLTRLEREAQLLQAQGRAPTEAMQTLAGLQRIQYILVYPATGDIVIAGPAGDWRRNVEGRFINPATSAPVLQLDDLVVTLRNAYSDLGRFGCSITPRQGNLAAAKAVNEKWSLRPLKTGEREKWLGEFRAALGRQDIEMYGIDRRTHAGRVLIEADYRMKLVGTGLEEGVPGVASYLSTIQLDKNGNPPPMNVLRWWFTLNYDAVAATESRDAFELRGPGVKVLSENELLTEKGERVHTGDSDELTKRFAQSFTQHFDELSVKYPIYAELRNVFDLSLVAAVIHSHDLPGQVGWHLTHFGADGDYRPVLANAPTEVESVLNRRIIGGKHVVTIVSGGVRAEPRGLTQREAIKTDDSGAIPGQRQASTPQNLPRNAWWWD